MGGVGYWKNRSITVKFTLGIGLLVCIMMIVAATGYMCEFNRPASCV